MFEAELRLIAIDLQGQTLDGRYRLDALLDVGPDRMLWRATDQNRQHTVAIQIWAKQSSPAESDLNAALLRQPENVHPNLVPFEACGKLSSGASYAVYPAFVGRYLDGWLDENAIGFADMVELASELAVAIAALHRAGQVHGKVGRSVVLAADENGMVLRIVDTGLEGLAAVPHGSAVRAELAGVGELIEKLHRGAATAPDMSPEASHAIDALVAQTREDAPEPFADMDQLAERLQTMLAAAPPRKSRGGQRKVTKTADFAGQTAKGAVLPSSNLAMGDDPIASLPEATDADLETVARDTADPALALTGLDELSKATQESSSVDLAQLADPLGDHKDDPPRPDITTESGELPELPPPAEDLPELQGHAGLQGAHGHVDAAHHSDLAAGPHTQPPVPRPPTMQLPVWPESKRKSKVDPRAVVVAVLLAGMIGVFIFVLLPGPDRPVTPIEALKVAAADPSGPSGAVDPGPGTADAVAVAVVDIEEASEPDTVVAALEPDTVVAALEPDTVAPEPDTVAPEPDTAIAAALDTAIVPDTAASGPDTALAAMTPDVVAAPDTAQAAVIAPDTATAPEVAEAKPDREAEPTPGQVPDGDLPVRQIVNSKDEIRAALAAVEDALKKSRKDGKGAGVTRPLVTKLLATFREGKPITVNPFGIFHLAMYMLDSGAPANTVGAVILSTHESGGF